MLAALKPEELALHSDYDLIKGCWWDSNYSVQRDMMSFVTDKLKNLSDSDINTLLQDYMSSGWEPVSEQWLTNKYQQCRTDPRWVINHDNHIQTLAGHCDYYSTLMV
jgi:hypothetical protein